MAFSEAFFFVNSQHPKLSNTLKFNDNINGLTYQNQIAVSLSVQAQNVVLYKCTRHLA